MAVKIPVLILFCFCLLCSLKNHLFCILCLLQLQVVLIIQALVDGFSSIQMVLGRFSSFFKWFQLVLGRFRSFWVVLACFSLQSLPIIWAPKTNSTITSKQISKTACLFFVFTMQKQQNILPSPKDSVTLNKKKKFTKESRFFVFTKM